MATQRPILEQLADAELSALRARCRQKSAVKGEPICLVGDESRSLFFIEKGAVHVTLDSMEGKEVILARLDAGECFGELSLILGTPRSANVIAALKTELLVLDHISFEQHAKEYNGFLMLLNEALATRLVNASGKIGDLALYDVYNRVYRTLRKQATKAPDGYYKLEKRPTHQELASMIGSSREMVTRTLLALEEEGRIETEGKRITFLDDSL